MSGMAVRKRNRLEGYDYGQNGVYFVTVCTKDRAALLCEIEPPSPVGADIIRPRLTDIIRPGLTDARPQPSCVHPQPPGNLPRLTDAGRIVDGAINNIPGIYSCVTVDRYVIMPNHVHLILVVERRPDDGQRSGGRVPGDPGRMVSAPTVTVSKIVGYMKQYVSKQIRFPLWQKSFHDHIVRDEDDYRRIAEYIENNPQRWRDDCFYPQ
jgi:REP element-mobilizing transposase RayT